MLATLYWKALRHGIILIFNNQTISRSSYQETKIKRHHDSYSENVKFKKTELLPQGLSKRNLHAVSCRIANGIT